MCFRLFLGKFSAQNVNGTLMESSQAQIRIQTNYSDGCFQMQVIYDTIIIID